MRLGITCALDILPVLGSTSALDILPVDFRPTRVPDFIKFNDVIYSRFSEAPLVAAPLIKRVAPGAPPPGTSSLLLFPPPSQRAGSSFFW